MNVDKLLSRYFSKEKKTPLIEVFDSDNIYDVYSHIVKLLTGYVDIEVSVLQALSYCFYEILDNVLTHSGKLCGTAIQSYDAESNRIKVLVGDDGVGILNSLQENPEYANLEESDALCLCKRQSDRWKGNGFWIVFHISPSKTWRIVTGDTFRNSQAHVRWQRCEGFGNRLLAWNTRFCQSFFGQRD